MNHLNRLHPAFDADTWRLSATDEAVMPDRRRRRLVAKLLGALSLELLAPLALQLCAACHRSSRIPFARRRYTARHHTLHGHD
jgi:hypothetical protein